MLVVHPVQHHIGHQQLPVLVLVPGLRLHDPKQRLQLLVRQIVKGRKLHDAVPHNPLTGHRHIHDSQALFLAAGVLLHPGLLLGCHGLCLFLQLPKLQLQQHDRLRAEPDRVHPLHAPKAGHEQETSQHQKTQCLPIHMHPSFPEQGTIRLLSIAQNACPIYQYMRQLMKIDLSIRYFVRIPGKDAACRYFSE